MMPWIGTFFALVTLCAIVYGQSKYETQTGHNETPVIGPFDFGRFDEFARKLPGIPVVPRIINETLGKTPQDDDYDDDNPNERNAHLNFNLDINVGPPGRGRSHGRGRGNKNKEQGRQGNGNPGRGNRGKPGRGNGRNKPGRGNQGGGKKKGQNPCGPRGKFCPRFNYIEALGLRWSRRVQNGTGVFVRSSTGDKQYLPIGYQEPDKTYGTCTSSDGSQGNCRHLEHCLLEEFREDFVKFLEYTCQIPYGGYVGVCCPLDDNESDERAFPFPFPQGPTFQPQPNPSGPPQVPNSRPPPPRSQCGFSEKKTSRIVGGRVADPRAWVWMVALIRSTPDTDFKNNKAYCGGVLISEFHVLTAAHCVDNYPLREITVRLGEYEFSRQTGNNAEQDFGVFAVKVHEQYNRYSYKNDIAVIRLSRSAYFNEKIRPICLPPPGQDESYVNEIGIVTGWGTIYYGGPTSDKLMEVSVPVWKQDDCIAAYTQPIDDTNLCAGVRSGSRDSCQGDSGGPLQLQGRDGYWMVVGIVSWGIRCSEPGYPGVYTRVSKYNSWIQKNAV